MTPDQITCYIKSHLEQTTLAENFGYTFFFYADDQVVPFASFSESDNEHDNVSQLNREGVYRLNIGVSKERFKELCGEPVAAWDYTRLNVFIPHPHYAAQHFICVLNPEGANLDIVRECLQEAHDIAKRRYENRRDKQS